MPWKLNRQKPNVTDAELARRVWVTFSSRRTGRGGMPFTVGFLQQQVFRGWGIWIGEHRAAAAIRELKRKRVLVPTGDYRSRKHGFRVTLYLLAQISSSVRRKQSVKWWQHPLFGFPERPKGYSARLLRRECG